MVIEITHENGKFRFSYKRHVIVAIGMAFLVALTSESLSEFVGKGGQPN
jgi:hypothetical protein